MFLLRNQVAASGFALLAMTMRASVESFVKIRPNSFDSTNSVYNPCSHRRERREEKSFSPQRHRGHREEKNREDLSLCFKNKKRICICISSVSSVPLW